MTARSLITDHGKAVIAWLAAIAASLIVAWACWISLAVSSQAAEIAAGQATAESVLGRLDRIENKIDALLER